MNMQDVTAIYKMLNWENPAEIQLEGLKFAKKIDDLSLLIQPPAPPSVWEQCANILSEKSDMQLKPYLSQLLEWLQDINWPGAITIAKRLKTYSGEGLAIALENAVKSTQKMSKDVGMMWLDYLSELLDNEMLIASLSGDTLSLLKEHHHNWANWDR